MTVVKTSPEPVTTKGLESRFWKFVGFLVLLGLCFLTAESTRTVVQGALADAYIAVSSFVAATLAIFYTLEHVLKLDTDLLLRRYAKWQVPIATLMGVLPGCGGAIIVITQYVAGRLGFGAVVAVLCSTMGDAAFLLLAQEPQTALLVYAISGVCGIICGYAVEFIHGRDFMKHEREPEDLYKTHCGTPDKIGWLSVPWVVLMLPGLALGIGNAIQTDTDLWFGPFSECGPTALIGVSGALLAVFMWAINRNAGPSIVNLGGQLTETVGWRVHLDRVIIDTNFVTVWVVGAFLIYELGIHWTGVDLASIFDAWAPVVPLLAVLIGFVPGCGPQILVTTFYLSGVAPLSAQLGNAISNDGDALFPAIALAPKTAILATLYTAVPALLIAYGWYFAFE